MPTTAFIFGVLKTSTVTNINRGAPLLLLLSVLGVKTDIADNSQMNREVVVSVLFSYLCSWARHFRLVDKFNTGL